MTISTDIDTAIGELDIAIQDSNEELTADFRTNLGLLDDDQEGLGEEFKARIGLLGDDSIAVHREMEVEISRERENTISRYQFKKFAKQNFINSLSTNSFSSESMISPLISKSHTIDKLASLSVWLAIQMYMKDRKANSSHQNNNTNKHNKLTNGSGDKVPMMNKIYAALEKHLSKKDSTRRHSAIDRSNSQEGSNPNYKLNKGWKKLFRTKSSIDRDKPRRSSCDIEGIANTTAEHKEDKTSHNDFHYTTDLDYLEKTLPSTDEELIQFIVGHGILRRDLRDEIFCQICRQLCNNPRKESEVRGWQLLIFCSGCFKPTEEFHKYLMSFLYECKEEFKQDAKYAQKLLLRTLANGTRFHPPNHLEIEASKCKQYIVLPISFAGGTVENFEADSATTSKEIVDNITKKIGLKEKFGFSIFIAIFHKVSSLGSGLDHVMDAISECEQVAKAKNVDEANTKWRLFFRKELFTPWFSLQESNDPVCASLIYEQICKGVKSKEYEMKTNESLATFIAQRHLVDYDNCDREDILKTVQKFVPRKMLGNGGIAMTAWTDKVLDSYKEQGLHKDDRPTKQDIILRIANRCPQRWPVHFSALFVAFRLAGPRHSARNEVVIAISGEGVYVMDEPFRVIIHLSYYQIVDVSCSRTTKVHGQSFSIVTVKGEEFVFGSPNTDIIYKQLHYFLEGLRKRSKFAVALENFAFTPDGNRFSFVKGDLIKFMDNTDESSGDNKKDKAKENWAFGMCERNGTLGYFPVDLVYILPTIRKPPDEFMECFKVMTGEAVNTLPRKKGSLYLSKSTIGKSSYGKQSSA